MNTHQWYLNGLLGKKPFVSTWDTTKTSAGSSTSTQVKLPLISAGTYNFVVQWGDGNSDTITVWNAAATTHTYASSGTYTITITGVCTGWRFNNGGDKLKILSVQSWGGLSLGTDGYATFSGCTNLNLSTVTDVLNTTTLTNLFQAFYGCSSLTSINRFTEWNTASITSFGTTFAACVLFDQNIGALNVSNCNDFQGMFAGCAAFNNGGSNSINNWVIKTTGTVTMASMFQTATNFNQPIGSWNTSAVNDMGAMFQGGSVVMKFNQNIGAWNVSNVTNFLYFCGSGNAKHNFNNGGSPDINNWVLKTTGTVYLGSMFYNATDFNQPIGSWNTSAVTNTSGMFSAWVAPMTFNNGLASGVAGTMTWNLTNVTTVADMFNNAQHFNQNLGALTLTNCTSFATMFSQAYKFNNGGNSSIGSWVLKTTGTVNFSGMFSNAIVFNQNISSWNTIAVTNMTNTFYSATAFQQNLGAWDVRNVANFGNFMFGKTPATFPTTYLDNIYNGWSTLPSLKTPITITFGTAKYTAASSAGRLILTSAPNNWVCVDGGI